MGNGVSGVLASDRALKDSKTGVLSGGSIALLSKDVDGVLTAQATIVTDTTYLAASLDGALVTPAGSGRFAVPRNVSVSTSSATGAYHVTYPVVITGVRAWDGVTTTESIYLTQANGADEVNGVTMWASIISVLVPGQHDTSGTISIGCGTAAMATGTCTGVVTPDGSTNVYKGNNHKNTGGGTRGLYVGTASSAHVYAMHVEDDTVTDYQNVVAGTVYPWWIKSIHEGTTATNLRCQR